MVTYYRQSLFATYLSYDDPRRLADVFIVNRCPHPPLWFSFSNSYAKFIIIIQNKLLFFCQSSPAVYSVGPLTYFTVSSQRDKSKLFSDCVSQTQKWYRPCQKYWINHVLYGFFFIFMFVFGVFPQFERWKCIPARRTRIMRRIKLCGRVRNKNGRKWRGKRPVWHSGVFSIFSRGPTNIFSNISQWKGPTMWLLSTKLRTHNTRFVKCIFQLNKIILKITILK